MSLRKSTLLAAAGIGAGLVAGIPVSITYLSGIYCVSELLLLTLFVLLYRELAGKGKSGARQDLAIAATIAAGIVLHSELRVALQNLHVRRVPPEVLWNGLSILISIGWFAFLILLVKDADLMKSRGMRVVAPVLALLAAASLCRFGYIMFFHVGITWLNASVQRGIGDLLWQVFVYPVLKLFHQVTTLLFLALLCKKLFVRESTSI